MADANLVWFPHPTRCWSLGEVVAHVGPDRLAVKEVSSTGASTAAATAAVSKPPRAVATKHANTTALVKHHHHHDTPSAHHGVSSTSHEVPASACHAFDPSHREDRSDIAAMNSMHEGPLLSLLQRRYERDAIYTFTGDILISINPYKPISGLYALPDEASARSSSERIPHVYTTAERAYRAMLDEQRPDARNQSLIVSGESGAGKTEACKHIMRYLAVLSERHVEAAQLAAERSASSISRAAATVPAVAAAGAGGVCLPPLADVVAAAVQLSHAGSAVTAAATAAAAAAVTTGNGASTTTATSSNAVGAGASRDATSDGFDGGSTNLGTGGGDALILTHDLDATTVRIETKVRDVNLGATTGGGDSVTVRVKREKNVDVRIVTSS